MDQTAPDNLVVMVICPNLKCRRVLQVPERYRNQMVRCRYCQTTFSVPTLSKKKHAPPPTEQGETVV